MSEKKLGRGIASLLAMDDEIVESFSSSSSLSSANIGNYGNIDDDKIVLTFADGRKNAIIED